MLFLKRASDEFDVAHLIAHFSK